MGLTLNGTNQWLQAAWSPGGSMQPMTFMGWVRKTNTNEHSIICAGDSGQDLAFNNMQMRDDDSRAISFVAYAEAQGAVIPTNTTTFLCAVFDTNQLRIYVGSNSPVSASWSPDTSGINQIRIGNTVSNQYYSYYAGTIEHAAVWRAALSTAQVGALRQLTTSPVDTDSSNLIAYLPLKGSLTDSVGTLSWSAQNIPTPSYTDLGITYGPVGYTVTYNANGGTNAPVDSSSPYSAEDTVTVLGYGSMARPGYTASSWNTAADGSGTARAPSSTFTMPSANVVLYAQWTRGARIVNHENFNACDSANLATINAAAAVKSYFEHASTGRDVVGNSNTNSSTGTNYNDTESCGLAELYAVNNRYVMSRSSYESSNDSTWFATHGGLQDNNRGNPTPATKVSGFTGMSSAMRSAVSVAMWKYCWIDVWPDTTGYITDGAATAASNITAIESFESANPGITHVWWTMPLQSTESYAARDAYNNAIRTYCAANNKYLIDIADIECHDPSGVKQLDGNSREIMYSTYAMADGGHLASAGRLRMARAFWSMLVLISGSVNYSIGGVTRDKNGTAIGSCTVSLFKHSGSGVFSYVGTTTSNSSTGAYSFTVSDNDSAYMVYAFKADTPHVFDASDYVLQPVI